MPCHDLSEETRKHPCYSFEAHHQYARMHLPVAPACNIQCNYCNRKFDCVNESRPGVTSEVLNPKEAEQKFSWVKSKIDQLTVVGIAGPGDALANWSKTKETFERIRAVDPKITFCLSTNGLLLPKYAQEIVRLGVHHVTVTMNCLDPQIGAKLYRHIYYEGVSYQGEIGAKILLTNQQLGIKLLTQAGVLVKVNIVMVKGINDKHIPEVVKRAKELGAFITNIMPLIPAPGSAFEDFPQTSMDELNALRDFCQIDMQQMRHCQQCRADAIGLLQEDRSQEFRFKPETFQQEKTYRIAVTSKEGKLVNLHFGQATEFLIYEGNRKSFRLIQRRKLAKYCTGSSECEDEAQKEDIVQALSDCDFLLTLRIGYQAKKRLEHQGIRSMEYCYDVESGLNYVLDQIEKKEELRACKKLGGAS